MLKKEKENIDTTTCPRCHQPMEEFATEWGWKFCYECSARLYLEKMEEISYDCVHPEQPINDFYMEARQ